MSYAAPLRGRAPVHFESALSAFFRRHAMLVPPYHADALIERQGLLLAMALAIRSANYRAQPDISDGVRIGAASFTGHEAAAAFDAAVHLAQLFDALADGSAHDLTGTQVDRMAVIMLRRAAADLTTDHGDLVEEGIPVGIVTEYALDAAQLAEAIKVAVRIYRTERAARAGRALREAA